MSAHRELRDMLGALALGQLDPAETAALRRHVAGCATCFDELREIEPVAQALAATVATELVPADVAPPKDLEDRIIRGLGHRRRRFTGVAGPGVRTLAVAAAIAAAFVVGDRLGALGERPAAAPPVEGIVVEDFAAGVTATAGLVTHTWGTEVRLEATGLTPGDAYEVTIVADDGSSVVAGSFLGTGERPVRCSVNAAVRREDAARVVVTDAAGTLVLAADAS